MKTSLFVFPIKPGKLEKYKSFIDTCVNERRAEYKDLLKRYGSNNIKMWHHSVGGKEYVLFIHDMSDDAAEKLKNWSTSTHPFDIWFNQHIMECYDLPAKGEIEQPHFMCELM